MAYSVYNQTSQATAAKLTPQDTPIAVPVDAAIAPLTTAENTIEDPTPEPEEAVAEVPTDAQQISLTKKLKTIDADFFDVPFYSQFDDISAASWKKIGCGIASLAMIINFYDPNEVSVDALLTEGIAAGAYIQNAGWSHGGLARLAEQHELSGGTHDLSSATMQNAFERLRESVQEGPVIASVHYTFDPKNPIPHLVVISGITDDTVYFNDPADTSGNGHISATTFKNSWKKRYISVLPS